MSSVKKHSLNSFEKENDISRILKHQISEPVPCLQQTTLKNQRSYSFLIGKQLKKLDLSSLASSSVSTNLSSVYGPSSNQSVDNNTSYLFNRQNSSARSFINKGFFKTRQSLSLLINLFFLFIYRHMHPKTH
jgi:hypothetical protein